MVTELQDRWFVPILVGRDPEKLRPLAAGSGLDARPASVEHPALVIEAALRAGIPYVDVAAEIEANVDTFTNFADRVRAAGIVLVPAMAFYGGLGDLRTCGPCRAGRPGSLLALSLTSRGARRQASNSDGQVWCGGDTVRGAGRGRTGTMAGQVRATPERADGDFVLTLSCPDRIGIVHVVAGALARRGCNIVDSQQHGDHLSGRFFMRVHLAAPAAVSLDELRADFGPIGREYAMDWQIHDLDRHPGLLIMVSRLGHCLNDLLYRARIGALRAEVRAIVSNHPDFEPLAASYDIPFHHVPVTPQTRSAAEQRLLDLVDDYDVDLVVLARYMQILSDRVCGPLAGRMINIHHSFLPSFVGARPYHQAYQRGVKLIGATAHYVTPELDAGPIIEQEVARVDHTHTPDQLVAVGRDAESLALSRAVQWHVEHRVLINGARTVVFR